MSKINIKKSLMEQLKSKSANVEHFADLISDYMSFWDIKKSLQQDIKNRGVVFESKSSVGVLIEKNNPSVKELVLVNRQMLSILKDLGLNTDGISAQHEDEL